MFQKSLFLFIFIHFVCLDLFSQKGEIIQVSFVPTWENKSVTLPFSNNKTTVDIFRCYVAHFELWHEGELVWQEENSFHLLDAEIENSMAFQLEVPSQLNYNQLKFQLGIDSTTNVSGAFGGDLDPTKGMFWAWNTGYINFKLEGSNPICETRKNKFQFHLGGYASPFASVQYLEFDIFPKKISDNEVEIKIGIQLDKFFQKIDLASQNSVMTPGAETVEVAKIAQKIFTTTNEK